ncbi:MAG: hypothetical protein JO323_02045 [Acidobacteriia bacterium]|nr:hypothetical protein [Terriglobia bacterium]
MNARCSWVPPWAAAGACAVLLFLLNALLCRELFTVEFTERMESIESSYIAISHWIATHWGHLNWFPLWFDGMPVNQVYQPGFHTAVAAIGKVTGWSSARAYHFFTALEYCLGPATFFLLCYRATKWLGYSLVTALTYSLISPANLLVPAFRSDTGNLITGRRFIVLVRYGEGPHTAALMLLPLTLLAVHYAVAERRRWAIALAPLSLAAVVLTNWPGTTGLVMALAAYVFSRFGASRPVHWPTMLGIAAIAYMLACAWVPPSIIRLVQKNAQESDGTALGYQQFAGFAAMVAVLLVLHYVFRKWEVLPWFRFFAYFAVITGSISIGHEWFGWRLLPQSQRFQLEFEMAFCGLAVWITKSLWDRSPRGVRVTCAAALAVMCAYQAIRLRELAIDQTRPIDITPTIEYRMAKWFEEHMNSRRVFAPGNVSLWMNVFTETPQMAGCCDQGIPVKEHRIADYAIYTGQNAGSRDAADSLLWLKAYGADALGVSGPKSTEYFHPFSNARKFEGLLPVLWREGDNVVYSVNRRSPSLAHVLRAEQLVTEPPANGVQVESLIPYVNAIEAPNAPQADFQWLATDHARVTAQLKPGQLVSIQITYHAGWQATIAGRAQRTSSDALRLLVVHPDCAGTCAIDLHWSPTLEVRIAQFSGIAGVLALTIWVIWWARQDSNL